MKSTCPNCEWGTEVPDEKIPAEGGTGTCPKCQSKIVVKNEVAPQTDDVVEPIATVSDKSSPSVISDAPLSASTTSAPWYLYIPVSRLIILSIVTCGLYEVYWMYKNWQYIKERDQLNIWPFWRGFFGYFFCYSLLRKIHADKEAQAIQLPTFSPGWLAICWVVLTFISTVIGRTSIIANLFAQFVIPAFLFLVPVLGYINSVSEKRNPGAAYYGWSTGHIVCLFFGCLIFGINIWAALLTGLGLGAK